MTPTRAKALWFDGLYILYGKKPDGTVSILVEVKAHLQHKAKAIQEHLQIGHVMGVSRPSYLSVIVTDSRVQHLIDNSC